MVFGMINPLNKYYDFSKGNTHVHTLLCGIMVYSFFLPTKCPVINCPPIPVWDDMSANTTDHVIHTRVNVSCDVGTNRQYLVSVCDSTGSWYPEIERCKGVYLHTNITNAINK
jgi:hypothetical protein